MSKQAQSNLSTLVQFLLLPLGYLWRAQRRRHRSVVQWRDMSKSTSYQSKRPSASLYFKGNLKVEFALLHGSLMPTLNPPSFRWKVEKKNLSSICEKEALTIPVHKMPTIDMKSLIGYFSAVLTPFAKGFDMLFVIKETGTLWFSKLSSDIMLELLSLEVDIFQMLDWALWISIWGRDECGFM